MSVGANLTVPNLFDFKNHVVLITGGATGLGEMAAQGFIQNGARVIIASRKESELQKTADRLNKLGPGKCEYVVSDLKDKAGCDHLVAEVKKKTDRLTVLLNNSGATWSVFVNSKPTRTANINSQGSAISRLPRKWMGQVDGSQRQSHVLQWVVSIMSVPTLNLYDCFSYRRPGTPFGQGCNGRQPWQGNQHCKYGGHPNYRRHHWRGWWAFRTRVRNIQLRPFQSSMCPSLEAAVEQVDASPHHGQLRLPWCIPFPYDCFRAPRRLANAA